MVVRNQLPAPVAQANLRMNPRDFEHAASYFTDQLAFCLIYIPHPVLCGWLNREG
jgi:hypothetical protein